MHARLTLRDRPSIGGLGEGPTESGCPPGTWVGTGLMGLNDGRSPDRARRGPNFADLSRGLGPEKVRVILERVRPCGGAGRRRAGRGGHAAPDDTPRLTARATDRVQRQPCASPRGACSGRARPAGTAMMTWTTASTVRATSPARQVPVTWASRPTATGPAAAKR